MTTEGLTVNIDPKKVDNFYGIWADSKDNLILTLDWEEKRGRAIYPLTIEMPCGNKIVYAKPDDFPDKSVPCPCGKPGHWLVKYKDQA